MSNTHGAGASSGAQSLTVSPAGLPHPGLTHACVPGKCATAHTKWIWYILASILQCLQSEECDLQLGCCLGNLPTSHCCQPPTISCSLEVSTCQFRRAGKKREGARSGSCARQPLQWGVGKLCAPGSAGHFCIPVADLAGVGWVTASGGNSELRGQG